MQVIVPMYHLVSDHPVPHIEHLYKIKTTQSFIKDLDFLLKNYQPIHSETLLGHILEQKPIPKNALLLTFDDGLSQVYDVIAPVLIQKGIPATCFVNSAFVDNKDLFYRYKASALIAQFSKHIWSEQDSKSISKLLKTRNLTKNTFKSHLLSIGYKDRIILEELALLLSLDFKEYLKKETPYLTSEQIKILINQGFTFGSHSIDHPEYQYLDLKEQLRQTHESTQFVCDAFSLNSRLFAFPFTDYGVTKAFFESIYGDNKQLDLSFGTAGMKKDMYKTHIQRIPLESGDLSAEKILKQELLYCLFKRPFGKNQITRN